MPESTKARRRAKDVADDVNGAGDRAQDEAQNAGDAAQDAGGATKTITSEMKEVFRDAAIDVLSPVMK